MRAYRMWVLAVLCMAGSVQGADEPVIGGRCQGCENVFIGRPAQLPSSARIAPAEEAGEPLTIVGVVRDRAGRPAPGIIVYAYHTDATGVYPRADTPHGRLRGWVRSDGEGRYRFDTIRPASYPNSDIPQHVHMHLVEPGRATYTIDDIVFSDDPRWHERHRRQMLRGRGGPGGLTTPRRGEDGVWRVSRDIRLGVGVD